MASIRESEDTIRRLQGKPVRLKASIYARIALGIISFFFPGLSQCLQRRHMAAFDFLILFGACLLISTVFVVQLDWGIWTPILMAIILLTPSLWAGLNAFLCKNTVGDIDTALGDFFLYIFYALAVIGPYFLVNNTIGFKIYRMRSVATHLEPVLIPGDVVVFDRDAYGLKPIGTSPNSDSVKIGDIIFHRPFSVEEDTAGLNVHWVLATPYDTLQAKEGIITVNHQQPDFPFIVPYSGPDNFGPIIVQKGELFLVDNRWELFPFYIKDVIGKASHVLFSKEYKGDFRFERAGIRLDNSYKLTPVRSDTSDVLSDSMANGDILEESNIQ